MSHPLTDLAGVISSGQAMLFTGAGFSSGTRDLEGNPLPDSAQMARELWPLVFEAEEPDGSSLQDLYDAALLRAPERLHAYVAARLSIGAHELPAHYAAWFSAPWQRIYTLNIDDLERAVARQFRLPRPLRSVSALAPHPCEAEDDAVDVVHLNGLAGEAATQLTFSTMQYASRLCGKDREYERLAMDLGRAPFVFVGTTLDEVVLWQHVELRRRTAGAAPLPLPLPSFLISPSLSRARQVLFENLGIRWIRSTIEEVASELWRDPQARG